MGGSMTPPLFIFFDAGMTLLRPHPGVGAAYAEHLADFGVAADGAELDRHFGAAWKSVRERPGACCYGPTDADARAFWYPIVRDTLARAGVELPEDARFLPTLFDAFGTGRHWKLFQDVEEALALAESHGAGLGVLSNFDSRLRTALAELGLGARFDPLVISCEVGAEKPHAGIFEAAARTLPAEWRGARLALIGDEPAADGDGAQRAGWLRCLIDRAGRLDANGAHPVARTLPLAVESILAQVRA